MSVAIVFSFIEQNLLIFIFDQSQVRVSVIQMLPSAEVDDLPVVVKFILQSVGDGDAFEVQKPETIYKSEALGS